MSFELKRRGYCPMCQQAVSKPAEPSCQECETGFPIKDGWHYGTQKLGMIPNTRCQKAPSSGEVREFPRDALLFWKVESLSEFSKKCPNHAFIGPHAADIAIELYDAVVKERDLYKELFSGWEKDLGNPVIPAEAIRNLIKERDALKRENEELTALLSGAREHRQVAIEQADKACAELEAARGEVERMKAERVVTIKGRRYGQTLIHENASLREEIEAFEECCDVMWPEWRDAPLGKTIKAIRDARKSPPVFLK